MFLKIALGKEIHVMNSKDSNVTLTELKDYIKKVFKKLPQKYMLTYIDDDGDQITIGNESDVRILNESGVKSAKIIIE